MEKERASIASVCMFFSSIANHRGMCFMFTVEWLLQMGREGSLRSSSVQMEVQVLTKHHCDSWSTVISCLKFTHIICTGVYRHGTLSINNGQHETSPCDIYATRASVTKLFASAGHELAFDVADGEDRDAPTITFLQPWIGGDVSVLDFDRRQPGTRSLGQLIPQQQFGVITQMAAGSAEDGERRAWCLDHGSVLILRCVTI